MTIHEFIDHIESLDEYTELRKRRKQIISLSVTAVIPLIVTVDITWGLNEPSVSDIETEFYVHEEKKKVLSDPWVKERLIEYKKEVKEYVKDMEALVKREAKKKGIYKHRVVVLDGGNEEIEEIMMWIA